MNEQVDVKFGATTGPLDAALSRIRSSLGSLGGDANKVKGAFAGLSSSFSGIFTGGSAGALGNIGSAMGGLADMAGSAAGALGPVGVAVGAVAAASVAATGTLLHLAEGFGDMAEKLDQTSQKLGMATADVMRWNAVAGMAGISQQSFSMSMVRLEKAMAGAASGGKKAAGAFQQLGIDVKAAKNPTEVVMQIADKFKTMPDGPQKIALAMQTMGRAGSQLIPVLNGGRDALLEQMKMAEEYGVVMDDAFIQKGLAVDDAMDQMNMGMDGVRNTLYDSLAPAMLSTVEGINGLIKAFIASYKEGGVVKDIMDGVAVTFDVLGKIGSTTFSVLSDIVMAFGDMFSAIFDSISMVFRGTIEEQKSGMGFWEGLFKGLLITIQFVATGFRQFSSVVSGAIRAVAVTFVGLSEIVGKALSWDWSGAVASFNAWKSKMVGVAVTMGNDIVTAGKSGYEKMKNTWTQPIKSTMSIGGPSRARADLDLGSAQASGGSKKGSDKAASEARKKAQEELNIYLEELKGKMDAAKENYTETMRLEEEKIARIKAFYGEDSKEYKAALNEKAAMQRAHQKELDAAEKEAIDHRMALKQIEADHTAEMSRMALDAERQRVEASAELGQINGAQKLAALSDIDAREYAIQVEHEARMYNLAVQALRDKLNLLSTEPAERDRINRQIEQLDAEHKARVKTAEAAQANAQTERDRQIWMEKNKIQLGAINSLANSWGNALAQMATGQATFADTVKAMWQGIVGAVAQAIAQMIAQWIAQQLIAAVLGKTIGGTTAASQIMANAGVAASGAYAATAAIPIIGPGLAPAAAATALAGAMGFLPLAFAAGGFDIPSGVNPLTQLHEEEMVLPKNIANPLRSMLASSQKSGLADSAAFAGSAAASSTAAMGGDVHYHDHTEKGMSPSQIVANRAALSKAIRMAHREGRFVGAKVLRS